ncbi:hypothetical protein EJ02DRAFT_443070 [Clathrospora elynae]|uniref:Transglutaminase-like domain-containing protein n=1 Tax=Clathrospora elynae TaxID=706981 RepID=A0A6A5T3V3_9PLEO|nr:hypothetical protein EJ02DRAFT_443070 [Clathrospora elynae]
MEATVAEELTSRFRALLSQKRVQTLRNLKAQAEDQLPPYSAIRNIPFVPVPPAGARAIRFKNMLFCFSNMPTRWENPGLLDEALQSVELGKIYDDAEVEYQIFEAEAQSLQSDKKAAWGYQDCVARALLRWFKRSFFTFVNNPPCSRCYSPTVVLGLTPPLPEEQSNGAKHVEHYKCSYQGCGNFERFPRYSDPFVLMRTRRGRCGEWANCFGMLCRAIGCRVRWVWNAEDYVWVEVYSLHRKRWVHVDPLEEVWDNPLIYTNSWGKPLSYCIAFSADGAEDVTRRYVRNAKFALDRFRSTESELLHIINDIRAVRHQKLGKADRMRLEGERIKEQRELQCQTIGELVRDLCSLSLVKLADGSIGIFEAWSTKAKENTPGQTGSASKFAIIT